MEFFLRKIVHICAIQLLLVQLQRMILITSLQPVSQMHSGVISVKMPFVFLVSTVLQVSLEGYLTWFKGILHGFTGIFGKAQFFVNSLIFLLCF